MSMAQANWQELAVVWLYQEYVPVLYDTVADR